jgi:hypothetical protein
MPAPVAQADPVAVVVPVYDRPDWLPAPGPEHEARRQARRDWLKQTCRDAYDRCGRKDPRWDAAAHEALAAFEAFHSRVPAGGEEQRPAGLAARRAIDAGCDDPLIQYVALLLSSGIGELPAAERGRLARGAVAGMERSTYPAIRRIQVLHARASGLAVGRPVAPDRAREARRLLDACCTLLSEAVRDLPPPARDETGDLCEDLIETYHALDNDRQVGYRKVVDALARGGAPEAFRLWVEGTFDTTYAWDARGDGWADTVTEEGWRGFHDRLGQARAALERSWDLDPTNARVAAQMITVCMGQGRDRGEMERWFTRAMKADPDCFAACENKIRYLLPKWGGSAEEVLAFGRECAGTGNYYARLPFLLPGAHTQLGGDQGDAGKYLRTDREAWPDVLAVYEPYLKQHPESRYERTYFARFAYWCGRYTEARRQFDLLGDEYWRPAFPGGANSYQQLREFLSLVQGDAAGGQPARLGPPAAPPIGNAVAVEALDQEPAKYADKALEVLALLQPQLQPAGGGYALEAHQANGTPVRNLEFRATRDLAAQWLTESRGRQGWARLIGRLEKVNPQGRSVFQVSQVAVLDTQGRVAKTLPLARPTVPSALPTLADVDAAPDAYAQQTVGLRATLQGGFVARGNIAELQVLDEHGVRPANLIFHANRSLAARWADERRPEKPVPVQLLGVVTREKALGRTIVVVTQVQVLDAQGGVVKSIQ